MIEPGQIRLSQFIDQPPAKVWQALTDPTLLAKWWVVGDVRPMIGHRFTRGPQPVAERMLMSPSNIDAIRSCSSQLVVICLYEQALYFNMRIGLRRELEPAVTVPLLEH